MKSYSVYPRLQHEIGRFAITPNDSNDEHIAGLPFWCNNQDVNVDGQACCLTHRVGLPQIRDTKMPLADFQLEFCSSIFDLARKKSSDLPLLIHLLKGRQMGFTEIVIRLIQYFSFNRYAGKKIGIMTGTNGDLAKKDLRRLYDLYKPIKETLMGPLSKNMIHLKNGTSVEAFASDEEAMTGDTKYACIFLDEAAKWDMKDDTAIFNSIMPIVRTNASDLFLVSTPKGPEKMFWKIWKYDKQFHKFKYPITRALGSIHTNETLQEILDNSVEDIQQEYFCEFAGAKDRVFHFDENDIVKRKAISLVKSCDL